MSNIEKRVAKVALLVLADLHVFDQEAWDTWLQRYKKGLAPLDSHWGSVGCLRDTFRTLAVECLVDVLQLNEIGREGNLKGT